MSPKKVPLKQVKLAEMNGDCLRLVSLFVRKLKSRHQIALRLQDEDILMQVSRQAKSLGDQELELIYKSIKLEIARSYISNGNLH